MIDEPKINSLRFSTKKLCVGDFFTDFWMIMDTDPSYIIYNTSLHPLNLYDLCNILKGI